MDLSKLSDSDLRLLANGNVNMMSKSGLEIVSGSKPKAEEVPMQDPTEGMSGTQKFLAGAGKAFYDVGRGVGQLVGLVDQKDIDAAKKLDAPLMKSGAGIAGNLTGNIATALPAMFVPGANTVVGSSVAGGLYGLAQPVATGEDRLNNVGLGAIAGGAGQGIANAIGRAVQPVRSSLSGVESDLANKARQFMPLNAAQETGSKPLRWIDSALDNLPFTADKQAAQKLMQREAWQGKLLGQIGETGQAATPDVLSRAYSRLGNEFRNISDRNNVNLGSDFMDAIVKVDSNKTPFSTGIDAVVEKALDLAQKGTISGKEYQNVRTSLTNAAKGAWASNPELGQALKTLRGALDNAADASISSADKAAWAEVRKQYKAYKSIEKSTDATTGNVSPKKLINELARVNPQGVKLGRGDQELIDLAKVGKQFVAENLPDSGTAQRSWYMQALQNPTAGLGGLLGFMHGGPIGAVGGAALGAGTPLAVQKALWSQGGKKYLSDGLMDAAKIQRLAPYGNAAAVGLLN